MALFSEARLAVYNVYVAPLRQSSDAFGYLRRAKELSTDSSIDIMSIVELSDGIFLDRGSLVYSLTDNAPIVLGLIMAVLGTGVIYICTNVLLTLG